LLSKNQIAVPDSAPNWKPLTAANAGALFNGHAQVAAAAAAAPATLRLNGAAVAVVTTAAGVNNGQRGRITSPHTVAVVRGGGGLTPTTVTRLATAEAKSGRWVVPSCDHQITRTYVTRCDQKP